MKKTALIVSLIAASIALTGCKDDLKAPQVKDWNHPMGLNIDSATETRMFKEKYCSGDAEIVNASICQVARKAYGCWRSGGNCAARDFEQEVKAGK